MSENIKISIIEISMYNQMTYISIPGVIEVLNFLLNVF